MKIIGSVNRQFDDDGNLNNADYLNGVIVQLTENEYKTLNLLQDAWDGKTYRYERVGMPCDMAMDDALKAAQVFVEAVFAVNDFKEVASRLEAIIGKEAQE